MEEISILIVDDDETDLTGVTESLASLGFRLTTLQDPRQVLQRVQSDRPDLVLLDALLPGLSGFDLCKQIKDMPGGQATPVVILTGVFLKDQHRHEALHQFEADGFLTKPHSSWELQRLVLRLLSGKVDKQQLDSPEASLAGGEERAGWWQQLLGKVKRASPAVPAADAIPREITTSENPVVAEPEEATRGDRGPEHGAGREAPSPPRPEEEEVGFELMEGAAWEGAEGKVPPDADDAAEQATPPAPPPAIVTKVPKDAETDAGAEGHVKQAERASPPGEQQKPSLEIEAPMPRARGPVPVCGEEDFRLELKRELSRCRRVGRPLTLILVRIADLSEIVELLGKDSRVQMLCHIAEQAVGTLREVDLIGLLASDERVALTAFASDRHGASRIVSRMQRALVDHPFNVGEGIPGIVPALRFGMASFPDQAQNADELLARAGREAES